MEGRGGSGTPKELVVIFRCHKCGDILEGVVDYYVHLASKRHGITVLKSGNSVCDVCNVTGSIKSILHHLNGSKHRSNTVQIGSASEETALWREGGLSQCDYCFAKGSDWKMIIEHMMDQHTVVSIEDRVEFSTFCWYFDLYKASRKKVTVARCSLCEQICRTRVDQVEHMKFHFLLSLFLFHGLPADSISPVKEETAEICLAKNESDIFRKQCKDRANDSLSVNKTNKEEQIPSIKISVRGVESPSKCSTSRVVPMMSLSKIDSVTKLDQPWSLPTILYPKRDGRPYCHVCKEYLPRNGSVTSHLPSKKHQKKRNKWMRGISSSSSALTSAFVDEKGWFHCKFCLARSHSVELMIIHVKKHMGNGNRCVERDSPSPTCFILNYESKVICASCSKDDTNTYSSEKSQLDHLPKHASKSRASNVGSFREVSISVRILPPQLCEPVDSGFASESTTDRVYTVHSQSGGRNGLREISSPGFSDCAEVEIDEASGGTDPSFQILKRLSAVSRELEDCLYIDEIEGKPSDDFSPGVQQCCRSGFLCSMPQRLREQIQQDAERAERFCWLCDDVIYISEEEHATSEKHQTSLKRGMENRYCEECHLYCRRDKDHRKMLSHIKSRQREDAEISQMVFSLCCFVVQSMNEFMFFGGLHRWKSFNPGVKTVFFDVWWKSSTSAVLKTPPFCMAFKFLLTDEVYAWDLTSFASYDVFPQQLKKFLISADLVFVGITGDLTRLRAGLSELICPLFLDVSSFSNMTLVEAALIAEPRLALPLPNIQSSLTWTDLIRCEFRFRLEVMNHLWNNITNMNEISRDKKSVKKCDHNGNYLDGVLSIEAETKSEIDIDRSLVKSDRKILHDDSPRLGANLPMEERSICLQGPIKTPSIEQHPQLDASQFAEKASDHSSPKISDSAPKSSDPSSELSGQSLRLPDSSSESSDPFVKSSNPLSRFINPPSGLPDSLNATSMPGSWTYDHAKSLPIVVYLKRDGRPFCRVCNAVCSTDDHLKDHLFGQKHQRKMKSWKGLSSKACLLPPNVIMTTPGSFHCKFCLAQSDSADLMIIHVEKHVKKNHAERGSTSSFFSLDFDGKALCDICKKLYFYEKDQLIHLTTHS